MLAIYIDTNQFRVEDDHTEEFKTGRRIKAYCNVDGYVYSTVLSSIYSDSYTTITIVENVLTSNLEDVLYGIVNIGETGAFPDHLHDGTEGQGGVLPHITATEFSTYSGTLQTQINNKPDTFLELLDTPPIYDSEKYAQSTGSGIIWSPITQSFLDLTDTPNSYSDGLYAKSTTSGIEWATVSGGTSSVQSFIDLTDTPNEYSSGKFAQSTSDGIIWTTVSGGTGASYGELELSYSANIVLDFTTYNLQSVLLSGNTSFTFTNMTNAKPCILNVIQDAQGSRAATFQSNVKWPQGVIPTTSSGSGLNDIYTFIQSRGTIYGDCVKAFQLGS
jgi:hypothetical protein